MARRFIVSVLFVFVVLIPAQAQNDLTAIYDLAYVENGDPRQTLDIYLPDDNVATPHPVLFLVHGGAFFAGDKTEVAEVAQRYAAQGYAVVAPNYRLAPDVQFPSSHGDVFCAMAWTFDQADTYNFDLNRITLLGESAGGNIAAYLGVVDDASSFMGECDLSYPENPSFGAVIALYAPMDLLSCECTLARRLASFYTGVSFFDWQDEAAIAQHFDKSVMYWIDENDPPFYFLHGDTDFLVPVSESEFFVDAYTRTGGKTELVVFEGANHGFLTGYPSPWDDLSYQILDEWIAQSS